MPVSRKESKRVLAPYERGWLHGYRGGRGITGDMAERARAALASHAEKHWGWGNSEYEDVEQAVFVVLRAALEAPDA